jgi:chromosomal replication initiation ATPase DnaA
MSSNTRQLVLDLPHRPALGTEDFVVTPSNLTAFRIIEAWPHWPSSSVVLCGPEASGKTHLTHVWLRMANAKLIAGRELKDEMLSNLDPKCAIAIEDADSAPLSEQTLFHLMNSVREHDTHLLITGRNAPGHWPTQLPDLRSRLRACPVAHFEEPDDQSLRLLLVKLLSDRQLPATPAAVAYLARHLDRRMAAASRVVEALDRLLWQRPSEITREVARQALRNIGQGEPEDET